MCSLILSQCRDLTSENGCDVRKCRNFDHSTCRRVLNLLEAVYLRLKKIVVKRVTITKSYSSEVWGGQ